VRLRVRSKVHIIFFVIAAFLAAALIAIDVAWPAALAGFVAVAGVVGAVMVLYEVRLTKQIAQSEFIRDLQSGFTTDPNICEIWRKLLMKEEIKASDRPLVSSYLTFFETLHLLLSRGTLELPLVDDLFRNRFFTAIGDKGILATALVSEAGKFANIHDLIAVWHDHLLDNGIPIHASYYPYIQALTEAKGYEVLRLGPGDQGALKDLQMRVLDAMDEKAWLRENTDDALLECLADHVALGVRKDGDLVAAAVLLDGKATSKNIRGNYAPDVTIDPLNSVNLKLVMVAPRHRGAGLARTLVELLEHNAADAGKTEILCTIHPRNASSKALFAKLGYRRLKRGVMTEYGRRDVFLRTLPTLNRRWARSAAGNQRAGSPPLLGD
jgi:predicted GNAT superfamily acetyltransferase